MNNYSITENITQNLRLKPMKACQWKLLQLETIRLNLTLVVSQGTAIKSSVVMRQFPTKRKTLYKNLKARVSGPMVPQW